MRNPGPGSVRMLYTINKTTADKQLTLKSPRQNMTKEVIGINN